MDYKTENTYIELSQSIQNAETRFDVQVVLSNLKKIYGLKTIAYFGLNIEQGNDEPYLAVTYSSDWINHYKEHKYENIDPVLKQGFRSILPMAWNAFDCETEKLKTFFGESREFGIGRNGVTIPVRGRAGDRALITLTSNQNPVQWSNDLPTLMRDFQIIAYLIHDTICKIENLQYDEFKLSSRELECLTWACRGKTVPETAIILNLSERTVRFYLDIARSKLNATNVAHATSKALSIGLISTH